MLRDSQYGYAAAYILSSVVLEIEIVDTEEKIREFTMTVESLFEQTKSGGLITLEKAEVIRYKAGKP